MLIYWFNRFRHWRGSWRRWDTRGATYLVNHITVSPSERVKRRWVNIDETCKKSYKHVQTSFLPPHLFKINSELSQYYLLLLYIAKYKMFDSGIATVFSITMIIWKTYCVLFKNLCFTSTHNSQCCRDWNCNLKILTLKPFQRARV